MGQPYENFRALMEKGRYMEASRFAEMAYLEGDKNNPFWLNQQAGALGRAGKHEAALHAANQALSLQPLDPYSIHSVAQTLLKLGRIDEALHYFEEIVADKKLGSSAQRGMLECLRAMKQWHRILHAIEEWGIPELRSLRWKVHALAGLSEMDEAASVCARWLELEPDNPQALWEFTEIEIRSSGLDAVLSKMARLAKIPSRPAIYKEIYASLCRRAGKPELALRQYERLSGQGVDIKIQRRQAFALAKSGKEAEAIPLMEELLTLGPKDFVMHSGYEGACKRTGQMERALNFYNVLLERHPEEKSLHGRIKKINKALGLKNEESFTNR